MHRLESCPAVYMEETIYPSPWASQLFIHFLNCSPYKLFGLQSGQLGQGETIECVSAVGPGGGGGGGIPGNLWPGAARFSKSWPYFRPKNCHFPHPFSVLASKIQTHFQTWCRQKLCHHYLVQNANKKISKNPFRIGILLFLSYPSGIETTYTFMHSRRKPYPNSDQNRQSLYPRFRPKRRKNHTL